MLYVRDETGKVINYLKDPAVVFDKDTWTLLKIGEKDDMERYFELSYQLYKKSGLKDMAEALVLMDLPNEQEKIDKVFLNQGYIKYLWEELMEEI